MLVDCPPSLGVLSIASLVAADGLCVVVQPGGFELQTLVHLGQTADLLRQHVNPALETIGAIVTNSHRRRRITDQVARELASQYDVLGVIRADAKLVYATTAGRIHRLRRSAAMEDYQQAADRIMQWVNVMSKQLAGIQGVLGNYVTPTSDKAPLPKPRPVSQQRTARSSDKSSTASERRKSARLGRPPGKSHKNALPKEKATLRIDAELMADYREWSWEERCQLGELVERALADYRRRHR